MHESDTYLAILDEGALKQAHKMVLQAGQEFLGPASEDVITALNGIEDLARLERLNKHCAKVASWQELLQVP